MKKNATTAATEPLRRALPQMPFDHVFETPSGNEELCHATGFEVCFGDPDSYQDWWFEYTDREGNLYYGG